VKAHDWYDILTLLVLSATLVFVCVYTCITGYQAWINRDTARRQLRAYLSVTTTGPPEKFAGLQPGRPNVEATKAVLFIKNGGQTPAYAVSYWIGITIAEFPLKTPLPTPPITFKLARSIIGSGDATTAIAQSLRPMTLDEERRVQKGEMAIYVFGEVKYRDAFRVRRHVTFRLFNQLWHGRVGSLDIDEEGNEAS
jgi:hypothetical protein